MSFIKSSFVSAGRRATRRTKLIHEIKVLCIRFHVSFIKPSLQNHKYPQNSTRLGSGFISKEGVKTEIAKPKLIHYTPKCLSEHFLKPPPSHFKFTTSGDGNIDGIDRVITRFYTKPSNKSPGRTRAWLFIRAVLVSCFFFLLCGGVCKQSRWYRKSHKQFKWKFFSHEAPTAGEIVAFCGKALQVAVWETVWGEGLPFNL